MAGVKPVNVKPYRYSPTQKDEIERRWLMASSELVPVPLGCWSKRKMALGDFVSIIGTSIPDPSWTLGVQSDAFWSTNAPATFQAAMNTIFQPLLRKSVLRERFFLNINYFSRDPNVHLPPNLWSIWVILCGVSTDPSKIEAIANCDLKQLGGFLGLSGYYRKFIRHYGIISRPLYDLLKKNTIFLGHHNFSNKLMHWNWCIAATWSLNSIPVKLWDLRLRPCPLMKRSQFPSGNHMQHKEFTILLITRA
ncbi:hypothetical protein U9M48_034539 [Paspalum notatum var. saurae]|uniref:Reverse transcriptase n=1 Tax=Paspalum notatum var. saurae TaxID=547442 RepID=A0AAQ3UAY6_PASNO